MGGHYISSFNADVWTQLTTKPTIEQCRTIANSMLESIQEELDQFETDADDLDDESETTQEELDDEFPFFPDLKPPRRANWPLDPNRLAESIRERLAASDWYADFTAGDQQIWDRCILGYLMSQEYLRSDDDDWDDDDENEDDTESSEMTSESPPKVSHFGMESRCENDGLLGFDVCEVAAERGASMLAGSREPNKSFGTTGFRYSGESVGGLELLYSIYSPDQVQVLLKQLEKVEPYFKELPDEEYGERDQFFRGLLEPVRKIAEAGRGMEVSTDY